jgi:hypothetical protein
MNTKLPSGVRGYAADQHSNGYMVNKLLFFKIQTKSSFLFKQSAFLHKFAMDTSLDTSLTSSEGTLSAASSPERAALFGSSKRFKIVSIEGPSASMSGVARNCSRH